MLGSHWRGGAHLSQTVPADYSWMPHTPLRLIMSKFSQLFTNSSDTGISQVALIFVIIQSNPSSLSKKLLSPHLIFFLHVC